MRTRLVRGALALAQGPGPGDDAMCDEATLAIALAPPEALAMDANLLRDAAAQALAQPGLGHLDHLDRGHRTARAAASALEQLWHGAVALSEASRSPSARIRAIARLEQRVREALPKDMLDAHALALRSARHVDTGAPLAGGLQKLVIDPRAIRSSAGRTLVRALARRIEVTESAPAHRAPTHTLETVERTSCATPLHEAMEAVAWAVQCVRTTTPGAVAIAAPALATHEDDLEAVAAEHGLTLAHTAGVRALASTAGQELSALAALAEQGPSPTRIERAMRACAHPQCLAAALNAGASAEATAQATLSAGALALYEALKNKALELGSLSAALAAHRGEDTTTAQNTVAFGTITDTADAGRTSVWVLGLTTQAWPPGRGRANPVLSEEDAAQLGLAPADRSARAHANLDTLARSAGTALVVSHPRREPDGRATIAAALPGTGATRALTRTRTEPKRARNRERAHSAKACADAWSTSAITAHDGLVRSAHPAIGAITDRPQSASSLRRMLRNPLGFVWRYALGWDERDVDTPGAPLDPRGWGNLIHESLENAIGSLEDAKLASLETHQREEMAALAVQRTGARWRSVGQGPSQALWPATARRASALCAWALGQAPLNTDTETSIAELGFGGAHMRADNDAAPTAEIRLPVSGLAISGYIDRADFDATGTMVRIIDWKSGRQRSRSCEIDAGRELQRCLYAAAGAAINAHGEPPEAWLVYVRERTSAKMRDVAGALTQIDTAASAALAALASGAAPPGPDAGNAWDPLSFALPANAEERYLVTKESAAREALGALPALWEAP